MANSEWIRSRLKDTVGPDRAEALYKTLDALGMTEIPSIWVPDETDETDETSKTLARAPESRKRVVVLGAGIGGLTTAYLLQQAGHDVTILEAQQTAGGRSKTARLGDTVTEVRDDKEETQTCRFDQGLYINLGPGRIPYHHQRVLNACKELGVELEVYAMSSDANMYRDREIFARAQPRRRIAADTQGYISELLCRAIRDNDKYFDTVLAAEGIDKDKLLGLLHSLGDLDVGDPDAKDKENKEKRKYRYNGSTRAGYAAEPTVEKLEPKEKNKFSALVNSEFWTHKFYQPLDYLWQDTLFQPVGGMDKIWEGFLSAFKRANADEEVDAHGRKMKGHVNIRYGCPVTKIELTPNGRVKVTYKKVEPNDVTVTCEKLEPDDVTVKPDGAKVIYTVDADYCVSNIPLPILAKLVNKESNFSEGFVDAVKTCEFAPACKVGWQVNERFWESDKNQIYGGISYVSAPKPSIAQMWYPSDRYHSGGKSTMTGCYNYDEDALELGKMSPEERLEVAWTQGKEVHPEFEQAVPKEKGISIAWQNVPYQKGGWADWEDKDKEKQEKLNQAYTRLLQPDRVDDDGVFWVVGDQVSSLPGWQEGAMMSAQHVVQQIEKVRKVRLAEGQVIAAPNTRRLVEGR